MLHEPVVTSQDWIGMPDEGGTVRDADPARARGHLPMFGERGQRPGIHRIVKAARVDILAIGGKGERPDRVAQGRAEIADDANLGGIDHHDIAFAVAHREARAIGAEGKGQNQAAIQGEIDDLVPCGEIDQAGATIGEPPSSGQISIMASQLAAATAPGRATRPITLAVCVPRRVPLAPVQRRTE